MILSAADNSAWRKIEDGAQYDRYFPRPETRDRVIIRDGEVTDTVTLMEKVVWKYLGDTKAIAPILSGATIPVTCRNVWDFLYHHIQYHLDQPGLEQLRRPARSWADRRTGIDCDCFSIFCSSILTNLQIPHSFRIVRYNEDFFQHVYVVVPDGGALISIDPVVSEFDREKPFTQKRDFPMNLSGIDVAVLSGLPMGFEGDEVYQHLIETRQYVKRHPEDFSKGFRESLDYALQHWNTPQRNQALEILAQREAMAGLGSLGNGFFDALKKVGSGIKTAAKAVVKNNPVSVLARSGFLIAMELNLRGMRKKLQWGYASQQQAAASGINAELWQRSVGAVKKVEDLWTKKLFGQADFIRKAILKGNSAGLRGGQGLGVEPVTTAAAITAATPVILAVLKIIKDAGLFNPGENTNFENLDTELQAQGRYMPVPDAGPDTPSAGGNFLGNNPGLVAAGVAALGVGVYLATRKKSAPKTKSKAALAGASEKRRKRTKRATVARKKSTIKTVTLK